MQYVRSLLLHQITPISMQQRLLVISYILSDQGLLYEQSEYYKKLKSVHLAICSIEISGFVTGPNKFFLCNRFSLR